MSQIKEINIKNGTYFFFNDMINIKNFDPNRIKIKKLYKNIINDYIGYITIKNFSLAKSNSANSLYFIIDKTDRHIEETNGNKYLMLTSTDQNKDILKNIQSYGIKLKI